MADVAMGDEDPGEFLTCRIEAGEMGSQVGAGVEEPGPVAIDNGNACCQVRHDMLANAARAATSGLRVATVLGNAEHPDVGHWLNNLTNNPLLILGKNQVDLGGITNPRSATAAT